MSRLAARNLTLVLMLAAFPLISVGTTGGQPAVWWLGLASLFVGGLIPPVMRYLSRVEKEEEPGKHATDLGESCRVC